MACKIKQRINELHGADSIEILLNGKIGNCHQLIGNRQGEYAMHLIQPYRLVFELKGDKLQVVKITSIEDYH